ncbi:hypothetical protein HERIO_1525 [Hepatospora eriocheir]|uniref:Uncharacterized protein n=1 Tax=Hepatospora eriocheir TaxID=1081669 RepID=A0A1X0QA15_9MICR|nr:hypothetical protein HERIO_1525 [Hepatospora eriocheir]
MVEFKFYIGKHKLISIGVLNLKRNNDLNNGDSKYEIEKFNLEIYNEELNDYLKIWDQVHFCLRGKKEPLKYKKY